MLHNALSSVWRVISAILLAVMLLLPQGTQQVQAKPKFGNGTVIAYSRQSKDCWPADAPYCRELVIQNIGTGSVISLGHGDNPSWGPQGILYTQGWGSGYYDTRLISFGADGTISSKLILTNTKDAKWDAVGERFTFTTYYFRFGDSPGCGTYDYECAYTARIVDGQLIVNSIASQSHDPYGATRYKNPTYAPDGSLYAAVDWPWWHNPEAVTDEVSLNKTPSAQGRDRSYWIAQIAPLDQNELKPRILAKTWPYLIADLVITEGGTGAYFTCYDMTQWEYTGAAICYMPLQEGATPTVHLGWTPYSATSSYPCIRPSNPDIQGSLMLMTTYDCHLDDYDKDGFGYGGRYISLMQADGSITNVTHPGPDDIVWDNDPTFAHPSFDLSDWEKVWNGGNPIYNW